MCGVCVCVCKGVCLVCVIYNGKYNYDSCVSVCVCGVGLCVCGVWLICVYRAFYVFCVLYVCVVCRWFACVRCVLCVFVCFVCGLVCLVVGWCVCFSVCDMLVVWLFCVCVCLCLYMC